MISRLFSRKFAIAAVPLILGLSIACGSDSANGPAAAGNSSTQPVPSATTESQPAIDEHADDDHVVLDETEHASEASEADEHAHGMASMDPDAPVVHVFATEFGYESDDLSAEAGEPFTIMLHNEGTVEHDITIEGFEEQGGIHLLPKEDGMATFSLLEPGEYVVYCTIPGHRAAGMESVLTINSHDEPDGHAN